MKTYEPQHNFDRVFPLQHLMLYYLNWYERSSDRWQDIKNCLIMDGYSGEHMSNADVYRLLLNMADDFNLHCAIKGWKLISIGEIMSRNLNDFYIERYQREGLPNPDWLVVIDKLMSIFCLNYNRDQTKIAKPTFRKGDPMRYAGYKQGRTFKQANKDTKKYNWEGVAPDWDWRKYYKPR